MKSGRRATLQALAAAGALAGSAWGLRGAWAQGGPAPALTPRASGPAPAGTPRRHALVIGNADYPELPLRNPARDAQAVHDKLRQLGFDSRLLLNVGWREMIAATQTFIQDSRHAALRLVYYAGHGAQVAGHNVLIPIDAPMSDAQTLAARSLAAAEILERLARGGQGVNLLILDSCRNNPALNYQLLADGRRIKVRGAPSGLAPMEPPGGSLVAFSTAPGSVAADGAGRPHSLYTHHLLRWMDRPGLPVEQLFKRVRIDVMRDTENRQRPWEESSLTSEACLHGC